MDWAQQPPKFLRFPGTTMVDFDVIANQKPARASPDAAVHPALMQLFETPSASKPENISLELSGQDWLAHVLQESLGLTAWKGHGTSLWALRANASSGALQPCDAYVLADASAVRGWQGGPTLFHYHPLWHALEVLAEVPAALWEAITCQLPSGSALVAVTGFYWRNAWKYGDPGVRYVHQDIGHLLGAIGFAGTAAGARMTLLEGVVDDQIAALLGLNAGAPADDEQAHALLALAPPGASACISARTFRLPAGHAVQFKNRAGRAVRTGSKVSETNVNGHAACRKLSAPSCDSPLWGHEQQVAPPVPFGGAAELRHCIAKRRSAHDFDVSWALPLSSLVKVLRAVMPTEAPFDALPFSRPLVPMLLMFAHRVDGLEKGLYALCRDSSRLEWLKRCAPRYKWSAVGIDAAVPLYLLDAPQDVREAAQALSCQQEWAGNSCVTFSIFAEYEPLLQEFGPWMYQRAHWEAGMVGQALYLGAEHVGCGGTAMGCFFGPWTHETLGIDAQQLQDLEHFTLGKAVEDTRVQTIPPYAHLKRFRALKDRDSINTGSEDKAITELHQSSVGDCLACSRRSVEGRTGTDDYAGQFYCGHCWASWDPKVAAALELEKKEDAEAAPAVATAPDAVSTRDVGDASRRDHKVAAALELPRKKDAEAAPAVAAAPDAVSARDVVGGASRLVSFEVVDDFELVD